MRAERSKKVLASPPKYISSTPFPTLLLQSLPTKHHEIYDPYNTVCTFIKHMKYDKAELVEIEALAEAGSQVRRLQLPRRQTVRPVQTIVLLLARVPEVCVEEAQEDVQSADGVAATEAELRTLHKGIALLNMCIQRSGAGDGPTSVVLGFLLPGPVY